MDDNLFPEETSSMKAKQSMSKILRELKNILKKHFEIQDWQGIEIILAVAVAHYIPGEMLWVRIIGASRSGKTELLRAISGSSDTAQMEAITPAALRGGLKEGAKLLQRINGKLVITNDLSAMLTTRKDARNEIFGLLRPIKDGVLISDFGSDEGHLSQSVKFDWIAATTPVFEQYRNFESLLGERFIDLRWIPGNRGEMAFRAGKNNPHLEEIRCELAVCVGNLMSRANNRQNIDLDEITIKIISELADKAAVLRTPVPRDRYRNLVSTPEPEIGTDLTQGFCRIVQGLIKMGIVRWGPYINRLVWDCMPKLRSEVLACIAKDVRKVKEIAAVTKLSEREISNQIEDLKLLGIVDHENRLCMQLHV